LAHGNSQQFIVSRARRSCITFSPKIRHGLLNLLQFKPETSSFIPIAFHTKALEALAEKKAKVGSARRTRKLTYAKVFAELKASGKTPEEIAKFINR
jgi:hypothetical protein